MYANACGHIDRSVCPSCCHHRCLQHLCPFRPDCPSLAAPPRQLAQVTCSLSQAETTEFRRVAGVLGIFLFSQAKALLRESSGQPCLLQFGADCTPLKLKSTISKEVGVKRATLSGHQTIELHVQQVFITTLDPQPLKKHCLVFREHVFLQHGKSMPTFHLVSSAENLQCNSQTS